MRRAKLRFGLLGGAVGLLVFLILFQQVLLGSLLESFTGALERQSADVVVYSEDARRSVAGSILSPEVVEAVGAVPGVAAAAPLGERTTTLSANGELVDGSVFGFVPGGPGEPTALVEGRLPASPGEAAASREDAADGFGLGATVTVEPGGAEVTVVGLTDRSRFSVSPTLWLTWEGYVEVVEAAEPDAPMVFPSLVAVATEAGEEPAAVAVDISAAVEGTDALTRSDAVAETPGVAEVRTSFLLILSLAYVVVGLVLAFFFLILTVQKSAALSLLRAVGIPMRELVTGLYLQVALVVGIGAVIGTGLVLLAAQGVGDALPLSIEPLEVAATLGLVVAVAGVGSLLALRRLLQVDPTDAVARPSLGGLA
ncbi:MAG: ABC transporter permease [Acidimicrobiia bacterium]|nr:ABC transporter permease [Acidimicrobiia bacterium]